MTNLPVFPYTDSCEQPHTQNVPSPHLVSVGFDQRCRTCQPYWGTSHSGFCRYHEVFVSGLHNCPDWELRICEPDMPDENENGDNETENMLPVSNDLLTQLADMKRRMRHRRRRKRRIATED